MDTITDDTNDDTHKDEEEYAKVIEDFFHLPQRDDEHNLIQNWHKQNCMTIVMSAPCQHYFCYSICKPNMVGVKPKLN
jgi:phosphorylcholine metabolism protein LicD